MTEQQERNIEILQPYSTFEELQSDVNNLNNFNVQNFIDAKLDKSYLAPYLKTLSRTVITWGDRGKFRPTDPKNDKSIDRVSSILSGKFPTLQDIKDVEIRDYNYDMPSSATATTALLSIATYNIGLNNILCFKQPTVVGENEMSVAKDLAQKGKDFDFRLLETGESVEVAFAPEDQVVINYTSSVIKELERCENSGVSYVVPTDYIKGFTPVNYTEDLAQ